MVDPQLVEHAQRGAGEVAQLGVVPLALELGDHHHRQHDLVLGEPPQRPRVGSSTLVSRTKVRALRRRRLRPGADAVLGLGRGRHGAPLTDRRAHSSPGPAQLAQTDRDGARGPECRLPGRGSRVRRSVVDRDLSRTGLPSTASFPTRRCRESTSPQRGDPGRHARPRVNGG